MTKKSIRILSLILAAALLVACCLSGCGEERMTIAYTTDQLCDMIKEEFPEAHVNKDNSNIIFFFDDEQNSERLLSGPPTCVLVIFIENLKNAENTKKILNTVMPIYAESWTPSDADEFLSVARPSDDFKRWEDEDAYIEVDGIEVSTDDYHDANGLDIVIMGSN